MSDDIGRGHLCRCDLSLFFERAAHLGRRDPADDDHLDDLFWSCGGLSYRRPYRDRYDRGYVPGEDPEGIRYPDLSRDDGGAGISYDERGCAGPPVHPHGPNDQYPPHPESICVCGDTCGVRFDAREQYGIFCTKAVRRGTGRGGIRWMSLH